MQGCSKFQAELFAQIDYEAIISSNHLLRYIDKILDLGFLRKSTKSFYSNSQGRPSIMISQKRMQKRSWIEGLFADAKERHGLRRVKERGLEKMQTSLPNRDDTEAK